MHPGASKAFGLAVLAAIVPTSSAQSCISLQGSQQCPAFQSASISTDKNLTGLYPFLSFVSTREEFDNRFKEYVSTDFVRLKYQQLLGCSNVTLTNTTNYYARYTKSVICNAIVQNSITPCGLSNDVAPPVCADTCAKQAIGEYRIAANKDLCGDPGTEYISQIRADFTNCALPADSLSGSCINGEENESVDCGYSSNLLGLCSFCGASSPNATDSCCVASNVTGRCAGMVLPTISSMPPLFPSGTSTPSATPAPASNGLSGGAIAGIVIGSVIGLALIIGLIVLCCIMARRRRGSQHGSILNQPAPKRVPTTTMANAPRDQGLAPGGRVARMTALEGSSSDDKTGRQRYAEASDSDPYGDSPESRNAAGGIVTGRRNASLSSNSVFGALGDETSPNSNSNQFSSPEGMMGAHSEQLPFFKDYYSQDEIHPGDKVATLWAYQPRAGDEFELERGDMLRVIGIWDDGWATGVRINDRAEDYEGKHKPQRDSGISSSGGRRESSPPPMGDIKAFPLVCVCLPEHWKKTVEGDSSDTTSTGAAGPHQSGFGGF